MGIAKISNYLSLVKFSHTIFAMPFAFIGFFLAVNQQDANINWLTFLYIILDMIFARNAAMGFNRYLDRIIDKKNPRTAVRDIPAGKISAESALFFVIINSLLFIGTTYFINQITFLLSPIALFVVLFYSYTKRFTSFCHLVLGVGLGLAPIGAYLAVTGKFDILPLLISFAVVFWVSGFDIIYALQDIAFDKSEKLKSIPVLLGKKNALRLSILFHLITIILLLTFGLISNLNLLYWIGFGIFSILLIYQHTIVKSNDLSKVNIAFFTTNGIASAILSLFTILSIFIYL